MVFSFKDPVKEWGDVYNAAMVVLSKDDKRTKQQGGNENAAARDVIDPPKKGTVGLVKCLDRLAKVPDFTGLKPDELKKAMAAAIKEVKALDAEAKKYNAILDKAINADCKIGFQPVRKAKDFLPDTYRQLKILKTELAALQARIGNQIKSFASQKETGKIGAEQAKGMKKARDAGNEVKAKEIEAEARLKKLLVTLSASYKSSMAKGAAVIQKVKASPDVATYNTLMNSGGRDIRQNILNIGLMKQNAGLKDLKEVKALPAPGPLAQEIEEFATDNGGLRFLPTTASKDDVVRAITKFSALYKRIDTTYKKLGSVK
ncbi:MAG: hypothetical protein JO255_05560 [Alphaproteobacteria bacterium]|nr:hypothetical protein [Alphaproteobacteria bacterium]